MSDLINSTWPVGKIFDLKVKATSEDGPLSLIGAMNDREDFISGIELLSIGFTTKMDSESSSLEVVMGFIGRFESGDYSALEEVKQFIITQLNNKYEAV